MEYWGQIYSKSAEVVEIYCHCQYNFSQLQDFGDKKGTKIDEKEIIPILLKMVAEKTNEMEKKIIMKTI